MWVLATWVGRSPETRGSAIPSGWGWGADPGGRGGIWATCTRPQQDRQSLGGWWWHWQPGSSEATEPSLSGFCFLGGVPFWGSGARSRAAFLSDIEGISPSPGPARCSPVLLLAQCPFPTVCGPQAGQGCSASPRDTPCTCFLAWK